MLESGVARDADRIRLREQIADPRVGIRLDSVDQAVFLEILRLYNRIAGSDLSDDTLRELAERSLENRKQLLRAEESSVEWRLGSRDCAESKLKASIVFERQNRQNPVLYFHFNPNRTHGGDDADQVALRNAFQTAADELLRQTGVALELTTTMGRIGLSFASLPTRASPERS